MCARTCALVLGLDHFAPERAGWNIQLVNGKARVLDHELCLSRRGECHLACLEQCPTKALATEFTGRGREKIKDDPS